MFADSARSCSLSGSEPVCILCSLDQRYPPLSFKLYCCSGLNLSEKQYHGLLSDNRTKELLLLSAQSQL